MNIQLNIVDNAGNTLSDVFVTFANLAGSVLQRSSTNTAGSTSFTVEQDTTIQATILKAGYSSYSTIVNTNSLGTQTIELYPISSLRNVAITCLDSITYLPVVAATGTLVGTSSAATKNWTDQNNDCEVYMDNIGVYQASVPSGVYTFTLVAPGYEIFNIAVDTTSGPVTETLLITRADNIFPLVVQAFDANGLCIQGATVYIFDKGGNNGPFVLTTDASGSVNVLVLEGTYEVYISAAGYQVSSQVIIVPEE